MSDPPPDEYDTLADARDWLRQRVDDGAICPCCTQFAKVYRRSLPNATARVMIALWRQGEAGEYLFLPDILGTVGSRTAQQGGYGTYGHHWHLLKQMPGVRDDGSSRVGWWRLTKLGREFVQGEVKVPRYAHIYNNRCLRFSGTDWSIRDALGSKFDYDELMGHKPPP